MEITVPIQQINTPSDIRLMNELRVLEQFGGGDTLTAAEIISATGISKPTVMKILQHLCSQGVIRSAGMGSSTSAGGKKPELYVFADERRILSINFWPQTASLALAGLVGDVYALETTAHELSDDLDAEILWLGSFVRDYFARHRLSMSSIYGVVVSTSGTVDCEKKILRYNSQAPGWGSNLHLDRYFEQFVGDSRQYIIENAGKVTGRAILADDPEMKNKRVLTVFTTWGVSGCLMENGRVLNGKDYLIGEIGHMTVSEDTTLQCGCGRCGCLEQTVSMKHILSLAEKLNAPWYKKGMKLDFAELFSYSKKGDSASRKIVKQLAHYFATMLHNVMLVYNPDAVVFQGSYAYADAYFDKCLRVELNTFRYNPQESVQILYDRTPLELQAAKGGAYILRQKYFSGIQSDTKTKQEN